MPEPQTKTPRTSLDKLRSALDAGHIDQTTFDELAAAVSAQLTGSGAIAQGPGSLAVGAGGVAIQRDNHGIVNLGVLIQQGTRAGASKDDLRRAYLARILLKANQLPLFASDNANAQVRLSSVYTALLTQRSETDADDARPSPKLMAKTHEREAKRLSALDILNAEKKLVLLGGPGSGKSTFVNFVALTMAGELLGDPSLNLATLTAPLPEEEENDEEPQSQRWDHRALLPVQVTLRDFASQLPPSGTLVNADTVLCYLQTQLEQAGLKDFAPLLCEEMLQGRALIFLDGLDEVPDALDRRVQIKQAVQDFAATFSGCRFLVTSRTYAYQRQDWKLDDFSEVHLLPFTHGQICQFVDAWYRHMVELLRLSVADASSRANVLKRTVERNERIRELAERPLLLTLIAQLQTEGGGTLPEKREELYDKAVEMLLNKWENMKVRTNAVNKKEIEPSLTEWLAAGRDDIRKQLNRLAFEAHRDQAQLTGTADIPQEKLITALLNASARREDVKVLLLEKYLRDRAGILAEHGVGMYQFPHRSFQEYLAACHLTDDEFPDKLAELARDDPDRWREVVLLAGAKAARGVSLGVWALSETLCSAAPPAGPAEAADHWGALLAGRVLVECADLADVAPRDEGKLDRVRQWQLAIMRQTILPATERALAGRTLAALGDTRPEVTTLDSMQFCLVPAGPFVMGDDQGSSDEKPEHPVDLAYPYFIARFPVTVAQWREYVQHGGDIPDDEQSLHGRDNDPVIYVNCDDALCFCDYLTQTWEGVLPEGWFVTLPSEAEWEKAARGGERVPERCDWVTFPAFDESLAKASEDAQMRNLVHRRAYPWGDTFDGERANIDLTIGETSAVGCYPLGASPYGCEEMSGNVWEWTRSNLKDYPYVPDGGRENMDAGEDVLRVVRGGSWDNHRVDARCAYRDGARPDSWDDHLGFRLVLRSAPVE